MNIYTQRFRARCPANERLVDYTLTLQSLHMVLVEDLQVAVAEAEGYHEQIADKLWKIFGGQQVITAHHHGTDVETIRP